MSNYSIKIKDKNIPVIIRNYKNTNKLKIYFRGEILNISKPKNYKLDNVIKKYGEDIYNQYINIICNGDGVIKYWKNGETILYKGEEFKIKIVETSEDIIEIKILESKKTIIVTIAYNLSEDDKRKNILLGIKKIFKKNTEELLFKKLEYWSKVTGINYTSFKVNDTISKYGSCMPKTKKLFFTLRLIMLKEEVIDSIIVHELCHIIYPNHSREFYNLVRKYIKDYDENDKWLKKNSQLLNI